MACQQCTDAWTWMVVYADNTTLYECAGSGVHHGYADVDVDNVRQIRWLPLRSNLQQVILDCSDTTLRPVLFRQRMVVFDMDAGAAPRYTAHCMGKSDGINQQYTFVFEDGTVLVSNDPNAGTNWIDKL